MSFFRSFRTLLVTAILVINLCILPFVVGQVMDNVEEGYATQFVDNARSTASLLSAQLATLDVNQDKEKVSQYLDDLIGLGHLTFAQLIPDNGRKIIPEKTESSDIKFSEDVLFGQHDDNIYFIAGPFFDSSEKMAGLYQFGFDESVTQYQMDNAVEKIAFYAVLFFVLSAIVFVYVAMKFTQPIAKLRDSANEIAAGQVEITLNHDSNIAEINSLTDSLEHMRTQLINRSKEINAHEIYEAEIMNNMADALIVIDENWCVHDMNWEAQKLFKIMREDVVGKEFSKLFSEDLMLAMKAEVESKAQKILCFEWAGCKRRDICLYLELKLSIVKINSGMFIVCSVRDMTLRKQTEEALLNAKLKSEDVSKAKSNFIYTMSHELRTPLNAILGYSDLLIEDAASLDKPNFIQDLNSIKLSAAHLLELINTVLDISKIEAGKMTVDVSFFTIQNLIDEILVTLNPAIEEKGNVFKADFELCRLEFETDFFKLKQIFINLIDNATKFTNNGEIVLSLHNIEPEFVEIGVTDSGIGISQNDLDRLFESFTQVDSSSTRQFDGTGLGLAISQKLCHLLGGEIRVESELGKGATFIVRLQRRLPVLEKNVA